VDEIIEQIGQLLEDIKQKNILVVVEGLKDVRSLKDLGISNVMHLKKPLYAVVEEIASKVKEVVLLTDLDEEGKKLYHVLSGDLQKHGVKIDNRLRELLFKTDIRQIEGLSVYLARAREES